MGRIYLFFGVILHCSATAVYAGQTQIIVRTESPMGVGSTQRMSVNQIGNASPHINAISQQLSLSGAKSIQRLSKKEGSSSAVFNSPSAQKPCEQGAFNNIYTVTVDDEKKESTLQALAELPGICYVESVREYTLSLEPDDLSFTTGAQAQLTHFGLPSAWSYSTGNSNIVIAIIDTGVNVDHLDLKDVIWQNPGETGGGKETNGIDDDGNGFIDDYQGWDFVTSAQLAAIGGVESTFEDYDDADNYPNDGNGHGTHVAGIAAAHTNNGIGIAGVAFNARIMPLRAGGARQTQFSGDSDSFLTNTAIAQALEYAASNGAHIVNMSFGGLGFDALIDDALTFARNNNVLLVASAGNGDANGNGFSISLDPNASTYISPASATGVLAVGSMNQSGTAFSTFSNFGPALDVSGPGESILSSYIAISGSPSAVSANTNINELTRLSGTSMASPFIAGLAALVWAFESSESNTNIDDVDASDISFIIKNSVSNPKSGVDPIATLGQISPSIFASSNANAPVAFGPEGLTGEILAYPNPFDMRKFSSTRISYNLTVIADVTIRIYSLHKTLVKEFIINDNAAAYHEVPWDGRDEDGDKVPNGVYYMVFEAKTSSKKTTKTHKIAVYR